MDKKIIDAINVLMEHIRGNYEESEAKSLYEALSKIREREELKHLMDKLDTSAEEEEKTKKLEYERWVKQILDLEVQRQKDRAMEQERNKRWQEYQMEMKWPKKKGN